ncbi:MAG: metallophosphoesterase family protein [Anaerolineales bacterium]
MNIAVLSDLHANLPALRAVLDDLAARDIEQMWCLGDMVGYYSDPVEPLMFVKRYVDSDDWVMGNHDAMLADLILPQDERDAPNLRGIDIDSKGGKIRVRGQFLAPEDWAMTNATPIKALELNRKELDSHEEATDFWRSQFTLERAKPRRKHLDGRDYIRVHASQHNYVGRYIYSWHDEILLPKEFQALEENKGASTAPQTLCFGHTHVPTLVLGAQNGDAPRVESVFIKTGESYPLGKRSALINPGSVGQSRDGDRRASYAILDSESQTVTFIRVAYPYQETAHRLLQKGYPEGLAKKLLEAPPVKEMPDVWKNHHAQNGTAQV